MSMTIPMSGTEPLLDELAACRDWSYHAGGPVSTEPAALTALALMAHDRVADARPALDWLAELQSDQGGVGVTATLAEPTWATSLAIIAWNEYSRLENGNDYLGGLESAKKFLFTQQGQPLPLSEQVGHDTTLVGWSWAAATHSWIEPTALYVLALKSLGMSDHARTREAIWMLLDRQISGGGCNYGNTLVLGQKLIPHHQPSAISLLALSGESAETVGRVLRPATPDLPEVNGVELLKRREVSLAYLAREWSRVVGTASTCYVAMALAAYDRTPADLQSRLTELVKRRRSSAGAHPSALLALAAAEGRSALVIEMALQAEVGA